METEQAQNGAAEPSMPLRALGQSGVSVPALGVGTNRWGMGGRGADQLMPVFGAAIDAGANLFDTAEVYRSEKPLGECMRRDRRSVHIVTKFAPYPTRLSARSFHKALDGSLSRLGTETIDPYLIDFPFSPLGVSRLMDRFAEIARAGKVRAIGVSNFSASQMFVAAKRLERHGIALAANEVSTASSTAIPSRTASSKLAASSTLPSSHTALCPVDGIGRTARRSTRHSRRSHVHERRQSPRSGSTGCCPKTNGSSPFPERPEQSICARTSALSAGR
jgi:hypothetical protein